MRFVFSVEQDGIANIKDFGAVGNGLDDDTAAIRKALKSLEPAGGYGGNSFDNFLLQAVLV